MNRRDFLKRIAAAGLVAAAPEILVPERRFWQLDRTMARDVYTPAFFSPDGTIGSVLYVDQMDGGIITNWAADLSGPGVFMPGYVDTDDPQARVAFVHRYGFVQAQVSNRFPEGIGIPANDRVKITQAYNDLRSEIGMPARDLPWLLESERVPAALSIDAEMFRIVA